MRETELNERASQPDLHERMAELARLAHRLLPQLLDESSALFVHKATWDSTGIKPAGANPLYSAMSTIGALSDPSGDGPNLDVGRTLDALSRLAADESAAPALVATTAWALALSDDPRTAAHVELLERRFAPRSSSSMDIGLVLAGLAAALDHFPSLHRAVEPIAGAATRELLGRFSTRARLFSATTPGLRPRHLLTANMTSFASQVYPIHGLAEYARATAASVPGQALDAADRIAEAQGPLGQWWWIYSPRTGAVLESYPVYSVHQDGMAFMALAPLQNLGLRSYERELTRGLAWLFGQNELGTPLVDLERPAISRCIQRRGADADGLWGMSLRQRRRTTMASWSLRAPARTAPGADELEILEEVRPYHLGWALYARSLIRGW